MRNAYRYFITLTVSLLLAHPALGQQASIDRAETSVRHAGPEWVTTALARFGVNVQSYLQASASAPMDDRLTTPLSLESAIFLLTQQTTQTWDAAAGGGAGDWMDIGRVRYTRNAAGAVTEQFVEEWDVLSGVFVPSFRQLNELDDQNRVVEQLGEAWNPDANAGQGDWEPVQRYRSTFDAQGNQLVRTNEFWDEDTGEYLLFNRTTFTYADGRVAQQVFESLSFFTGMFGFSLRYTFQYDGAGNTIERVIESYDSSAGAWKNFSRKAWTRDGNGQEVEDLEQTWDENANGGQGAWVDDYREVTVWTPNSANPTERMVTAQDWDPAANGGQGGWVNRDRGIETMSGQMVVVTEQDWDPSANGGQGDWVNREQDEITLDASGNAVEFVSRTWNPAASGGQGDWENESRGSVVYNEQGLVTESITQSWDGTQWVNESRTLQLYEEFTGTSVEDDGPKLQYRLLANYPNPFTAETQIRFALPRTEHVTLEVFDLLGRRVTTLVDGLTSSGSHEVTLEGSGLAGGLYVYRLQGDNVRMSRTMMLVR